jgi:SAM-dependent methyltransferase
MALQGPIHPTRTVQFTLMAALLGVALPYGIGDLLQKGSSVSWPAGLAFLIMSLNFFHGKIVTLEDEDYNLALLDRPVFALLDYALNLIVVLTIVVMAFRLKDPLWMIWLNILLRLVDVFLVRNIRSITADGPVCRAQTSWLFFDVFSIAAWLATFVFLDHFPNPYAAVASVFLGITLLDIAMDYTYNRKLYFSNTVDWNLLSDLWDRHQGPFGDTYHRGLFIPSLKQRAGEIEGRRVLDLGCRNGCVARNFAQDGAIVTAVDRMPLMVKYARSYMTPVVSYECRDYTKDTSAINGGRFDVIVGCLTVHTVDSLACLMRTIKSNLGEGAKALLVYECLSAVASTVEHGYTRRRWVDKTEVKGCRKQLIFFAGTARGFDDDAEAVAGATLPGHAVPVVIRLWSESNLFRAAESEGLEVISDEIILPVADLKETMLIRRYRMQPRFRLVEVQCKKPLTGSDVMLDYESSHRQTAAVIATP